MLKKCIQIITIQVCNYFDKLHQGVGIARKQLNRTIFG